MIATPGRPSTGRRRRALRSADYDIMIAGEVSDEVAFSFAPLDIECCGGNTVIHGRKLDQAALLGLLARLPELGLTLLRVERGG
jgi:hypothetical protein